MSVEEVPDDIIGLLCLDSTDDTVDRAVDKPLLHEQLGLDPGLFNANYMMSKISL